MSKLIKVTNATEDRNGEGLILNTDLIISFFEHEREDGERVSIAYGMNGNNWEIKETIEEINDLIK